MQRVHIQLNFVSVNFNKCYKVKSMKIFIVGNYGLKNLGDELILASIIYNLRKKFKNSLITVLSFDPQETTLQHKVNSILNKNDFKNLINICKEIYKSDIVLCGGGGILMVIKSIRPVLYYFLPIYIAKVFLKPIFFYGVGAGPINTKLGRFIVKITCNLANAISVRDEKSKNLLQSIGVKKPINVTLDPAIFFRESSDIPPPKNIKSQKPIIGISIVPWGDKRYPYTRIGNNIFEFNRYKRNIAHLVSYIVDKIDAEIILIPMKYPSDTIVIDEIIDLLPESIKIKTKRPEKHELSELFNVFRDIDLFIGCRLHSIILSTIMNIPTIAIAYHEKVKSYMELLKEEERVIEIDNFNMERIYKVFEETWNNRESITMNLKRKIEKIKVEYKEIDIIT